MIKCLAVATITADAISFSLYYLSRVIASARRLRTKETNNRLEQGLFQGNHVPVQLRDSRLLFFEMKRCDGER